MGQRAGLGHLWHGHSLPGDGKGILLKRLQERGCVLPVWDFRAAKDSRWALDTSASACAASGLLELYSLMEDGPDRDFYYEQALAVLKGLYDSYFDHRQESQSMIQMGTVHFPAGKNINVPIIYGDFFFTEALIKLKHKTNIF